jgi:hypothetical protein
LIIDVTTMTRAMTPAWIVYAWAPVLWQAADTPELHLIHLGTRVLSFGDASNPCTGQTLWCDQTDTCKAGVAWDWVELRHGVVAMSDPLGVVTNLRLVDPDGAALNQAQIALRLHEIVHALPWQTEVERALRAPN